MEYAGLGGERRIHLTVRPKKMRLPVVPEAHEQAALFNLIEGIGVRYYPELRLLYHIPNGGKRNAVEAAHLKQQGVKAGVPDLCLPVAKGKYHGLYIEMKVGDNKPTEKQTWWLKELEKQGYATMVCYGYKQAAEVLVRYLTEGKGNTPWW